MDPLIKLVKERRRAMGLTQKELANKAGVGLRFIRELEQGKRTLRMDKVNQVLSLFDCRMAPVQGMEMGERNELRESEKRFRSIAENATDSIFMKDADRRYTFVNPAMLRALGVPASALLGKTPTEVFGPEQAKVVKQVDDRTFAGETVDETEMLIVSGEERFFHTLQTPVIDDEGVVTSIMGIVRDVTQQRRSARQDFHDTVGQQLVGMSLLLSSLRAQLSATDPDAAGKVAQIEKVAGETLASARALAAGPGKREP